MTQAISHPNCAITVVRGDITRQPDCDAIVNSANQNLRAGSGVCGAIYRVAGRDLEPYSMQFAPLGLGEAVATPGFNLPNRLIIHTRGPKYFFDPEPARYLAAALRNTLMLAETESVTRVAVPAISMGIYRYPPDEAIPILIDTARAVSTSFSSVREVRFVVTSTELEDIFSRTINS